MCSTILSCRYGYAKNKTKQNVSQSFIILWNIAKWTDCGFDLSTLKIRNQQNTVLCEVHFEEKYIVRGGKSNLKLNGRWIPYEKNIPRSC